MDAIAREILVLILTRLRLFEKARLQDEATLTALRAAFCSAAPEHLRRFEEERYDAVVRQTEDPGRALEEVYAGLIELLQDSNQNEKEKQEEIRRLSEPYEGPIQ
jgi:hypothetical protein